jgi:hypothetical protein
MCCVCAFSLHQESPDMILGGKPIIFEVVLSHPTWTRPADSGVTHPRYFRTSSKWVSSYSHGAGDLVTGRVLRLHFFDISIDGMWEGKTIFLKKGKGRQRNACKNSDLRT